jgi:hypothetical protein
VRVSVSYQDVRSIQVGGEAVQRQEDEVEPSAVKGAWHNWLMAVSCRASWSVFADVPTFPAGVITA